MKKLLLILSLLLITGCTPTAPKVVDTHQMPDGTVMDDSMHMAKVETEQQFLNEMIPHHLEAVDTSKVILDNTQNAELKKFVASVMDVQTKEVDQMVAWLKDWYADEYVVNYNYMPMMNMNTLVKLQGTDQDDLYITGMIFHHQGAVKMAKEVLELEGIKPETKALAENIIKTQTEEIKFLEGL
jgi:uncharacterized protein (DUF305 family)